MNNKISYLRFFALISYTLVLPLSTITTAQAVGIQNDFNKDGFDDLVIGVSSDNDLKIPNAGSPGTVNVIKGSAAGLTATGNQLWNQNSPGIPGTNFATAGFGTAVASADFNGDGFADLAVGSPSDGEIGIQRIGEVTVIYGTATGLTSAKSQLWHQGSANVLENPEFGDGFGRTLAVGDFNNDHFDDLAVGVPSESLPGASWAGVVHVFYGSLAGISATNNQLWHQDSPGIAENAQGGEFFGTALASGDFDNDGFDDLAIGVPVEHNSSEPGLGAVHVLYGAAGGLSATGNQLWSQDSTNILGTTQSGDLFGSSLGH